MSIHFNPNQPKSKIHTHSHQVFKNSHHKAPHRHSQHKASTLTIQAQPVSCLDRLKLWFASIFSSLKNLFSRKPAPNVPNAVPPSGLSLGKLNNNTPFKKDDYNYAGYTQDQIAKLHFAMNGCAFPKLALYLQETNQRGLPFAVASINKALLKAPSSTTLTAKFVLQNS